MAGEDKIEMWRQPFAALYISHPTEIFPIIIFNFDQIIGFGNLKISTGLAVIWLLLIT